LKQGFVAFNCKSLSFGLIRFLLY